MSDGVRAKILVAEDNRVNQRIITNMLARLGYDADVVENGAQAVSAAAAGAYAAILMDCHMPEMDGMEASAKIRANAKDRGAARLPIIAVTANVVAGEKERCIASGMDDYLSKPLRMQALNDMLERWVKASASTADAPVAVLADGVLDREQMLEWADGDMELVREAAELLIKDCERMMSIAQKAIEESNSAELVRAAHNIKGGVGNFGAKQAYDAAYRLEHLARDGGESAQTRQALAQLRDELRAVTAALAQL